MVKVAVIGGGSTYTPELIEGIARRNDRLPVDELVLMDVSAERLELVGGVAGASCPASVGPAGSPTTQSARGGGHRRVDSCSCSCASVASRHA